MKRGIRSIRIPIIVRIMTGSTLGKTTPEDIARAFAAQHIMPQISAGRLEVPFSEETKDGQDRPLTFSGTKAGGKVSPADPGPADVTFGDRERIITAMCYTRRHDYGLDRQKAITSGMTASERQDLRSEMAKLFEHHIEPLMLQTHNNQKQLNLIAAALRRAGIETNEGTPVHVGVTDLATMYTQIRTDHDRIHDKLEASGDSNCRLVSKNRRLEEHLTKQCNREGRIKEKLRLKPGTPIEDVLGTIQSIQQDAERYRVHNRTLANGDRLISQDEYERLLAIERDHQTSKSDARAAEAALERAHADISTFASEAGFPNNVTADGSRRATLRQVLAHIKDKAIALDAIRDALNTGGVSTQTIPSRIPQVVRNLIALLDAMPKIRTKLGLTEEAGAEAILRTIDQLQKPVWKAEFRSRVIEA